MGEEQCVPGVIESIYSMKLEGTEAFVIGVRRRKALQEPSHVPNPFPRFPDFGAEIWSRNLTTAQEFVPLTKPIYHIQSMAWKGDAVVLKPIIPVSSPNWRSLNCADRLSLFQDI